jgi:hypothetical protein
MASPSAKSQTKQQPRLLLAVTRGRIGVDESLLRLPEELRQHNFRVDIVSKDMELSEVKQLVEGRFLTARHRDFLEDIEAYEYCLISAHLVQHLPTGELADLVSRAWTHWDLHSKPTCLVTLQPSGKATLTYPECLLIPVQPTRAKRKAEKRRLGGLHSLDHQFPNLLPE